MVIVKLLDLECITKPFSSQEIIIQRAGLPLTTTIEAGKIFNYYVDVWKWYHFYNLNSFY